MKEGKCPNLVLIRKDFKSFVSDTLAITKFVLQWRIHASVGLADHPRDHVMAAVAAAEVVAETEAETEAGNVMVDTGPVAVHTAAAATNAANGVILVVIAICAGAARIANVAAAEAGAEAQGDKNLLSESFYCPRSLFSRFYFLACVFASIFCSFGASEFMPKLLPEQSAFT